MSVNVKGALTSWECTGIMGVHLDALVGQEWTEMYQTATT